MPGPLYAGLADALADAETATGHTFIWQGKSYPCVLNIDTDTLITSKVHFLPGKYPAAGQVINVGGKDRHVLGVSNARQVFVPGGYVSPGAPFVDDPNEPQLAIIYGSFIKG